MSQKPAPIIVDPDVVVLILLLAAYGVLMLGLGFVVGAVFF